LEPIKKKQLGVVAVAVFFFPLSALSHPVHERFFSALMPPFHTLLSVLSALVIGYGMWRYRLFAITQSEILRQVVRSLVDPLFLVGKSGIIEHANPSALSLLGYSEECLLRKSFDSIFRLEPGLSFPDKEQGMLVTLDHRSIPVLVSTSPVFNASEMVGSIILCKNISDLIQAQKDREAMQEQLIHSAKLASVGTLSAGIAHELNNPLTAIKGFAEVIVSISTEPQIRERASRILDGSIRMKAITDGLKTFARKSSKRNWRAFDIVQSVRDTLTLFEPRFLQDGITIHLDVECPSIEIIGDGNQLQGVIENLLTNSRDAFSDLKDDRKKIISITVSVRGGMEVCICFQDNAGGMTDETRQRLFEPFFTTKGAGHGTGLGMAIALSTVKEHRGTMMVSSRWGEGSVFTITLPLPGAMAGMDPEEKAA
jgi:PAS domain S-box-containing protein